MLIQDEQGRLLMRKRSERLLHNLWEYVNLPEQPVEKALQTLDLEEKTRQEIGTARHVFTHIVWHMKGMWIRVKEAPAPEGYQWITEKEMDEKAVPTAFIKFTEWGKTHLWHTKPQQV
ncbi:MAG: NUDIX domain-containing protein [Christensenellales bacterium]